VHFSRQELSCNVVFLEQKFKESADMLCYLPDNKLTVTSFSKYDAVIVWVIQYSSDLSCGKLIAFVPWDSSFHMNERLKIC
jgi:hypothetical protein